MSAKNTYFPEEVYNSEINLSENDEVIKAMHKDGIKSTDQFPVDLYFMTDSEEKANNLKKAFESRFPDYTELDVADYGGDFEILVTTTPIEMNLKAVNDLNKIMWDLGYEFDCMFDGWEAGPLDDEE